MHYVGGSRGPWEFLIWVEAPRATLAPCSSPQAPVRRVRSQAPTSGISWSSGGARGRWGCRSGVDGGGARSGAGEGLRGRGAGAVTCNREAGRRGVHRRGGPTAAAALRHRRRGPLAGCRPQARLSASPVSERGGRRYGGSGLAEGGDRAPASPPGPGSGFRGVPAAGGRCRSGRAEVAACAVLSAAAVRTAKAAPPSACGHPRPLSLRPGGDRGAPRLWVTRPGPQAPRYPPGPGPGPEGGRPGGGACADGARPGPGGSGWNRALPPL